METGGSLYIILGLSVVFSALFSGIEIAYLAANRLRLELDRKSSSLTTRIIQIYLDHRGQFIASILVGNNVANVIYGMVMARILHPFLSAWAVSDTLELVAQTVISTFFILIFAEFLPKVLFHTHSNSFLKIFALPVFVFYVLVYPVSRGVTWISNRLFSLLVHEKVANSNTNPVFGKVDLNHLVDELAQGKKSEEEGVVSSQAVKLFQNALEFSDLKVRECLIPRPDIQAIEINDDLTKLRHLFISTSYSRIPVYDETIDNIVGYVNAKSIFTHPASIRDAVLPIDFVPETMKASALLAQFTRTCASMAIVVDEFGGTAGLVTIEDLIEEIFGEINDEHDTSRVVMKRLGPRDFLLSGRAEVEAVNEMFGLNIPEHEAYDTVAGYILHQESSIPKPNDEISLDGFLVKIIRVDGSRITLLQLHAPSR